MGACESRESMHPAKGRCLPTRQKPSQHKTRCLLQVFQIGIISAELPAGQVRAAALLLPAPHSMMCSQRAVCCAVLWCRLPPVQAACAGLGRAPHLPGSPTPAAPLSAASPGGPTAAAWPPHSLGLQDPSAAPASHTSQLHDGSCRMYTGSYSLHGACTTYELYEHRQAHAGALWPPVAPPVAF